MAKVSAKKAAKVKGVARSKAPKEVAPEEISGSGNGAAVATEPAEPEMMELQPPTQPIEAGEPEKPEGETAKGGKRDTIAASMNIAKLQAMTMTELNHMAKDLGVENFGTMRKHEVIFHILQKNAERSGVLFSEGVLEVLTEGFGFLRSQSFN